MSSLDAVDDKIGRKTSFDGMDEEEEAGNSGNQLRKRGGGAGGAASTVSVSSSQSGSKSRKTARISEGKKVSKNSMNAAAHVEQLLQASLECRSPDGAKNGKTSDDSSSSPNGPTITELLQDTKDKTALKKLQKLQDGEIDAISDRDLRKLLENEIKDKEKVLKKKQRLMTLVMILFVVMFVVALVCLIPEFF